MTLQQLKYMITVAETGTITEAAKELYISQPSLSGALSLVYWRDVHEQFFLREPEEAGLCFDQDMLVVCKEFACVYTPALCSCREHAERKIW